MGKIRTIARRSFLIGSVAVAGGVAFGTYKLATPHANPLLADLKDGEVAFNPFVKISKDAITLITPHADVGQGVISAQAILIAEELDVELDQFEVTNGAPSAAYYNTAMAGEAAPFLSSDESRTAETMRSVMGGLFKLLGMQGTGGSSSMPDQYEKLRMAGAVARETLKLAASKQSGVAVEDLGTEAAHVILPNGTKIAYTDLAKEAAKLDPVRDVVLRDPKNWRLVGQSNHRRVDILAKSTGTQDYGIDLFKEGMVNAVVRANPRNLGKLNGFDASKAEAMAGVDQVIEIQDAVVVIANNTWIGFQALDEIEYDWGPAPFPAEQSEHWAAVEASFTEERLDSVWRDDGDARAAEEADGRAVEAEYKAPYVAHQPMEPLNAVVEVAKDGASATVWTGHQIPRFLQQQVAAVVGCEADSVTFNNMYSGGSFGHRLEFEHVKKAAEVAVKFPGQAVKLTFSREEDFAHDFARQITMSRGTGTVKDGAVETFDLEIASVSSSASQMGRIGLDAMASGPDAQIVAGAWNLPYVFPNYRVAAYRVPELAPTSSWRSVGASTAGFFADCLMDELCHAAKADPLQERLRLIQNPVYRGVLETVQDMSSWDQPLAADSMGYPRGRGVAFVESFGVPVAEVVEVTDTPDGIRIDKVYVAMDVGKVIDPVNFENQVQGGVVWALGHAINSELTLSDGIFDQTNYHAHEGMRMYQTPEIVVKGLENAKHVRGAGEPMVPPAAPALANAIFNATGKRLREMPFDKHVAFI